MSDGAHSDGPKRLTDLSPVIHSTTASPVVHVGTIPKKKFCPYCGFRLENEPGEVAHGETEQHLHVTIPAADSSLEGRAASFAKSHAQKLWGYGPAELESKLRTAGPVKARSACMWALRMCGFHLVAIGDQFGHRDHSTVLHALHATNVRREQDPSFNTECQQLFELTQAYLSNSAAEPESGDSASRTARRGATDVPDYGADRSAPGGPDGGPAGIAHHGYRSRE